MKVIEKLVFKFVFEVDNYKELSFNDYDVLDFFAEYLDMKANSFDWKESDDARIWIAKQKKVGLEVLEVDDGDDSIFLLALKHEYWPTVEYIAKLMTSSPELVEPELE
mgnify:CR=1 FL=1